MNSYQRALFVLGLACGSRILLADTPDSPQLDKHHLKFGSFSVYTENDKFNGGTDRDYTNGLKFTFLTTDLRSFDDPEVPRFLRVLPRWLDPLIPDNAVPKLGLSFGQNIYTPENIQATALQSNDRPYSAWLYLGAMYQTYLPEENGWARMDNWEVQIGTVGPSALGEQVQNNFHHFIHVDTAKGWRNQIHDEPCLNLVYERKWRHQSDNARTAFGWDVIPHAGLSLGNAFTYANAGASFRFGYRLPDDFGTNLIRPSGDSSALTRPRWSAFLFTGFDGRAVARDITLDGNSFRNSYSVDKEPFVADLIVGGAIGTRKVQLTYSQVLRTKEFKMQNENHIFGSISLNFYF